MKNFTFNQMSELEKKARLCGVIANKASGKLSKEEIVSIVNGLDLSVQYKISLVTDAKEFADKITLVDQGHSHSWAGSYGTVQGGECLLGEIQFGVSKSWSYSDNGRDSGSSDHKEEPVFDMLKNAVVMIRENDYDHYNNPSPEYDNMNYYLYIYIPNENEAYKLDEKTMALIQAFDLD